MTGRHLAALRVTGLDRGAPLPVHETPGARVDAVSAARCRTIAGHLRDHGYATASIGKWHLGNESPPMLTNIAGTAKGQPPSYFSPYNIPTLKDGPPGESLTERLTNEALHWIEHNRARPFFLYLPHFAVHTPVQAKPEVVAKFRRKIEAMNGASQGRPAYAALIESGPVRSEA